MELARRAKEGDGPEAEQQAEPVPVPAPEPVPAPVPAPVPVLVPAPRAHRTCRLCREGGGNLASTALDDGTSGKETRQHILECSSSH